jgi:hypothetical protein
MKLSEFPEISECRPRQNNRRWIDNIFSELSLTTWWSCRPFLQEDFRAVDWTWLWNVATTRYQSILIYRMSRPKYAVFSAERNYAKQILLFDDLVTVVPITCDHTFAPCNPVANPSTKVSGEISFTNFRSSARISSVVWNQEPGSSRFKQRKREKSDGAISREYGDPGQIWLLFSTQSRGRLWQCGTGNYRREWPICVRLVESIAGR